jgi:hypothetical protein
MCFAAAFLLLPLAPFAQKNQQQNIVLAQKILSDASLKKVDSMARALLTKPFNAGDGYSQVWLRDMNTFIDIALEIRNPDDVKNALKFFFEFQQPNNEIVDCIGPKDKKWGDPNLYYSPCNSKYVGFKNTVEGGVAKKYFKLVKRSRQA